MAIDHERSRLAGEVFNVFSQREVIVPVVILMLHVQALLRCLLGDDPTTSARRFPAYRTLAISGVRLYRASAA
jgi:hypothetical protein